MIKMIMINWNVDCYVYYVDEYCDDACWLCTPPTQIAIFQYFDEKEGSFFLNFGGGDDEKMDEENKWLFG